MISPYPKKYEIQWKCKNGKEALLRPIKTEDESMWLEMFQSFSEEAIRCRFCQLLKDTSHEVRVCYCNIDYDREITIVAELSEEDHKRILGVGGLSIESDGKTGELAFIIVDQWQGQGLGNKIVDFVLEIAKEMNVKTVYAMMLPDNRRALNLTKKMAFKLEYLGDSMVKGVLDLKEEVLSGKCPEPKNREPPTEAYNKKKAYSRKRKIRKGCPASGGKSFAVTNSPSVFRRFDSEPERV